MYRDRLRPGLRPHDAFEPGRKARVRLSRAELESVGRSISAALSCLLMRMLRFLITRLLLLLLVLNIADVRHVGELKRAQECHTLTRTDTPPRAKRDREGSDARIFDGAPASGLAERSGLLFKGN